MSDVLPRHMAESAAKAPTLTCRQCQAVLAGTERFCPGCGSALPAPAMPPTSLPAEVSSAPAGPVGDSGSRANPSIPDRNAATLLAAAVASAGDTFACPHCSQALPREAVFCFHCGQKLAPTPPAFHLCQVAPDRKAEQRVKVEGELVIGKAPECGLVIAQDPYVSRQHVRVSVVDGKLRAEDLGSSNGTFLRLRRPVALEPGDELVIGAGIVRIELP